MSECNGENNPIAPGTIFQESRDDSFSTRIYQQAIGQLLYIARGTRPDLAASVGILAQFVKHPSIAHWEAMKHVFAYLQRTKMYGLVLGGTEEKKLTGYSDSDWGSNSNDRKSRSGIVIYLGTSVVGWISSKQETVAKSTTEAEYVALSHCISELLWFKSLLYELGEKIVEPIEVGIDNRAARILAENGNTKARTKHIDIKHHFIRDHIQKRTIKPFDVSTDDMVADVMTKGVSDKKLLWCVEQLGLHRN
jgi:hypothetical protein